MSSVPSVQLSANQRMVLADVAGGNPYGASFNTDTLARRTGRNRTLRSLRKLGLFRWGIGNGGAHLTDAGRSALEAK